MEKKVKALLIGIYILTLWFFMTLLTEPDKSVTIALILLGILMYLELTPRDLSRWVQRTIINKVTRWLK